LNLSKRPHLLYYKRVSLLNDELLTDHVNMVRQSNKHIAPGMILTILSSAQIADRSGNVLYGLVETEELIEDRSELECDVVLGLKSESHIESSCQKKD